MSFGCRRAAAAIRFTSAGLLERLGRRQRHPGMQGVLRGVILSSNPPRLSGSPSGPNGMAGIIFPAMTRVAVFIDYQNVYKSARSAFLLDGHGHLDGQVYPRRVGLLVVDRGRAVDASRELVSVAVYRGEPSPKHSPKGQAACQRQVRYWDSQALVRSSTRPLKYYPHQDRWGNQTWEPREKGIDVRIALDMARGAMRDDYDTCGSGTTSTTRLKCPCLRRPTHDPFFKLTRYSAGERSKAPRYSLGQASRSARPTQGSPA